MKTWFLQLEQREQYTLVIGAIALVIILFYFLIYEPFVNSYQQLQTMVSADYNALQWMQNAAQEIKQLRQQQHHQKPSTSSQSLLALIDSSIRKSGLDKTNKRIEPRGDNIVNVSFEMNSFTTLITWLADLYNKHHIQIQQIHIEHIEKADNVKVNVILTNI